MFYYLCKPFLKKYIEMITEMLLHAGIALIDSYINTLNITLYRQVLYCTYTLFSIFLLNFVNFSCGCVMKIDHNRCFSLVCSTHGVKMKIIIFHE